MYFITKDAMYKVNPSIQEGIFPMQIGLVLFHRITDIRLCVKGRICEESIGIHIVNVSQCLLYSLRPDCTAIKLVEFGASKILQCANSAQLFIVLGRLESP